MDSRPRDRETVNITWFDHVLATRECAPGSEFRNIRTSCRYPSAGANVRDKSESNKKPSIAPEQKPIIPYLLIIRVIRLDG